MPGLVVTVAVLFLQATTPAAIAEASNLLFDFYQRASPRPYQETPVRVVDIDDTSLAKLGQWPWPRTDIARLAQKLGAAGAAAIAFDMVFSEPDRTSPARIAQILRAEPGAKSSYADIAALPDHDTVFGRALAGLPAVTGFFLSPARGTAVPRQHSGFAISGTSALDTIPSFAGAIVPLQAIDSGATGSGFVSLVGNRDGLVRSIPLLARIGSEIYPSLSTEALRVAQGAQSILIKTTTGSGEIGGAQSGIVQLKIGSFVVPTTRAGELWMYYRLPRADDTIPAWEILTSALSDSRMKSLFDGRIVFVGAGAAGLRDLVATPVAERELGASVHAQAVEQIVLQRFLVRPDWSLGLERALILACGIALTGLLPVLGALWGGVLAAVLFAAGIFGSWMAFRSSALLIDPTYVALEIALVYVASTLFAFYREERARAYMHRAFDRYVSPELVRRIASDPSQLELGGEERDMTVMFCDIRGFSHISEKLTPPQVIAFMIEFLTPTSEVLLAHKATIDKFIGDAILAFWNAPLDDPDHVTNAAYASLALSRKMNELNSSNAINPRPNWPGTVRIGIGLDSGPCCVGNIGSAQRLNYSLIGDTVNLASRIEGLTKVYGVSIAMGQGAADRLGEFAEIEIDRVRVVGRDGAERIHTLLGSPDVAKRPDFLELARLQLDFLRTYRAQEWDAAEDTLAAMDHFVPTFDLQRLFEVYRGRIAGYRRSPPPGDWDGVFEAAHK
ncbi:MAG: adenylate/guanylate cyclase domain-containing protein [Alphaproteobacteria bacterium]|nr:adenylate/guanylate cyclase domain-containing protein [Alphaproteobacteria bacterium]